jgi:phenylalanine-4-hydroxylase
MHWWTVEYGLIGTTEEYKLYGAGLLSSVGESQTCMQPAVKKLPMSIDCVNYDYDITSMQPQLFVSHNWKQLMLSMINRPENCFRYMHRSEISGKINSLITIYL